MIFQPPPPSLDSRMLLEDQVLLNKMRGVGKDEDVNQTNLLKYWKRLAGGLVVLKIRQTKK